MQRRGIGAARDVRQFNPAGGLTFMLPSRKKGTFEGMALPNVDCIHAAFPHVAQLAPGVQTHGSSKCKCGANQPDPHYYYYYYYGCAFSFFLSTRCQSPTPTPAATVAAITALSQPSRCHHKLCMQCQCILWTILCLNQLLYSRSMSRALKLRHSRAGKPSAAPKEPHAHTKA